MFDVFTYSTEAASASSGIS